MKLTNNENQFFLEFYILNVFGCIQFLTHIVIKFTK